MRHPRLSRALPLALVAALAAIGTARADASKEKVAPRDLPGATDLTASYDFFVGGIRIAEVHLGAEIVDGTYSARSEIATRGVLELLLRGRVTSQSKGERVAYGRLVPDVFLSDYETRTGAQRLEIAYEGVNPANVALDPPEEPQPHDIAPKDQIGTLDPLTAALAALLPAEESVLCNRTIPIYDGKRRYDVIFLPPEPERFDKEAPPPAWKRPLKRCFGVYERIAGYEDAIEEDGRYFPFDIWFEETGKGVYRAVRLAGKTKLGYAIGTLRAD